MSDVNANDLRKINSIDDVIHTYEGSGDDAMTGIEVELAFFDPATPELTPMTIPQNKVVKNATNTECSGEFARNEPTSEMLEIGSAPGKPDDLKAIIEDTDKKIACLTQKAADIGLKRSYFQDLPNITAQQLLQNVVPVERYQAFFAPPRSDMTDIAAYFSVCKSNQVSVSYTDTAHLLANIRRLYALSPVIFMLTDNGSGYDEGQAFSGHAGMKHRAALKTRGNCPDESTSHTLRSVNELSHVLNRPNFRSWAPRKAFYQPDITVRCTSTLYGPSGRQEAAAGLWLRWRKPVVSIKWSRWSPRFSSVEPTLRHPWVGWEWSASRTRCASKRPSPTSWGMIWSLAQS